MTLIEDLQKANAKMYDTIIAQGEQLEHFEKVINLLKILALDLYDGKKFNNNREEFKKQFNL